MKLLIVLMKSLTDHRDIFALIGAAAILEMAADRRVASFSKKQSCTFSSGALRLKHSFPRSAARV